MISAGIDVGSLVTKAAVLVDGDLAGWQAVASGESSAAAAREALAGALARHGIAADSVDAIATTGAGAAEAGLGGELCGEVLCAARGARRLCPGARGVIELGAESTRAIRLAADGSVLEFAANDRCAAGTGVFLDAMARVLRVSIEEIGPLSLTSRAELAINSTCIVFAESEVVSLIHRQTPRHDILRGLHRAIATRTASLVARVGLAGELCAVGGLAQNVGLRASLEELLRTRIEVPERPQLAAALGAALCAAGRAAP
jgi:benzoyl-CoA reductase subunit D